MCSSSHTSFLSPFFELFHLSYSLPSIMSLNGSSDEKAEGVSNPGEWSECRRIRPGTDEYAVARGKSASPTRAARHAQLIRRVTAPYSMQETDPLTSSPTTLASAMALSAEATVDLDMPVIDPALLTDEFTDNSDQVQAQAQAQVAEPNWSKPTQSGMKAIPGWPINTNLPNSSQPNSSQPISTSTESPETPSEYGQFDLLSRQSSMTDLSFLDVRARKGTPEGSEVGFDGGVPGPRGKKSHARKVRLFP